MDRRQQKTRNAIFSAFTTLLNNHNLSNITVQDIIDEANIGRSTFYAHFDTKDALQEALCKELFDHIIFTAMDKQDTHGLYACTDAPNSVTLHILKHLLENDNNILTLLTCQDNEFFIKYFKNGMKELISSQISDDTQLKLPKVFLVNHLASSFVDMVRWWLEGGRKQNPAELDEYFRVITESLF